MHAHALMQCIITSWLPLGFASRGGSLSDLGPASHSQANHCITFKDAKKRGSTKFAHLAIWSSPLALRCRAELIHSRRAFGIRFPRQTTILLCFLKKNSRVLSTSDRNHGAWIRPLCAPNGTERFSKNVIPATPDTRWTQTGPIMRQMSQGIHLLRRWSDAEVGRRRRWMRRSR